MTKINYRKTFLAIGLTYLSGASDDEFSQVKGSDQLYQQINNSVFKNYLAMDFRKGHVIFWKIS